MSRRILLALALVAFMALPASAAVQNVKVSGSIDSTWLVRDNFDLGKETGHDFYQNLLITQSILRIDADLTDNVSAVIQLINEREWGDEDETATSGAPNTTEVDIDLAYVTLREMLYSPLTVIIGRQILRYGNAFIIGDIKTNNATAGRLSVVADDLSKRKAFDAVRAILDYDPLTVDLIAARVDENSTLGRINKNDVNLFGINTNWKLQDERNSDVEAYFFAKIDRSVENNVSGAAADTVYTPGLRVASNPIDNLYTSAEIAWQFGNKTHAAATTSPDNLRRDAMGLQLISSYAIPLEAVAKYSPVFSSSYTLVTGDSNPTDLRHVSQGSRNVYTAWDPMFEDQGGGTIYNSIMDLSNCQVYNSALQFVPFEDITAKLSYTTLYLDKEFDNAAGTSTWARTSPDGVGQTYNINVEEDHLGYEVDVDLMYDYTEDVQIGFSAGWFVPGDVFHESNDEVAKQFLTNVNVNF
ncbi:MAG: alginate export family protein [Candidatus Omnitrophota bacterium]